MGFAKKKGERLRCGVCGSKRNRGEIEEKERKRENLENKNKLAGFGCMKRRKTMLLK